MLQMNYIIIILFIITPAIMGEEEYVGYNCNITSPNMTMLSLNAADRCDLNTDNIKSTNVSIEVHEVKDFETVHVIQCKIEIFRDVVDCSGIFNYVKPANLPFISYLYEVNQKHVIIFT